MRRLLLFTTFISLVLFSQKAYPQCSTVPVQEAVYNGNFELGYSATPPGFQTDFQWLGLPPNYPTEGCHYGVGDKAGIVRGENFTCGGTNWTNTTYWGISYGGDVNFRDHTFGVPGQGYALMVDLNSKTTSTINPGGKPIAWMQSVNIFPSQTYYFSAWVANFANGTAPQIQVTIVPYLASNGTVHSAGIQTLPVIGSPAGLMNWTQIYAQWIPAGVYNKVDIRMEFVNTSGGSSGLDVVIDDISFINSCQNLTANKKPDFGFLTRSICSSNGSITLNANYPSPSGGTTFTWYEGSTSPQTVISGVTGQTYTVNKPGTYRVCVNDPANGCAVSAQAVITTDFTVNIPNRELCSPITASLNATPTPTGGSPLSYSWTVPGGATNPGNNATATANVAGTYSVNVTGPSYNGGTCVASGSATVTSKLPNVPTNLKYCSGGGTAVNLSVGDGKSYSWYRNAAATDLIGTGTTVSWTPAAGTTGNQTLYIVNAETTPAGTVGPASATNWPDNTGRNLTLNVTNTVQLTSLQLNAASWHETCAADGTTRTATITVTQGASTIATRNVTITCGSPSTVNLNINLPPGTYTLSTTANTKWTNTLGTTTIPGTFSISSPDGRSVFTNIVVRNSQACDPVPVVVQPENCCTAPTITTQPIATQTVCAGAPNFNISVTATPPAGEAVRVQWQNDGGTGTWVNDGAVQNGVVNTAFTSNYTHTSANLTTARNNWNFRAVVSLVSNTNCIVNSTVFNLRVNAIPSAPTVTTPVTYCQGDAATALTATGTALKWYDAASAGTQYGTAPTPSTASAGTTNYYVSQTVNSCESSRALIAVVVNPKANITTQPTAQNVCTGQNATFTVTATGSTLSYQWQIFSGGSWINASGTSTNASYTVSSVTSAMNGNQYKVIVRSNGNCPVESNTAVLNVTNSAAITVQPQATTTLCSGTALNLSVTATGATPLTYQWKKDGNDIAGATGATYNKTVDVSDAGVYTVVVTNSCNAITSSNANVTVNGANITVQPTNQGTCSGGNISFSVTATGPGLTYTWQRMIAGNPSNLAGETNSTLNLNSVTVGMDGYQYRVEIRSNGACPVLSNVVTLNVNTSTTVNTQPQNSQVCIGQPLTLTTSASGSGTVTYQWYKDNVLIPGATSATYSVATATSAHGGTYYAAINSDCGPVNSQNAVVTMNGVTINTHPQNLTVCEGDNVSFNVAATGFGTLSYVWQVDNSGTYVNIPSSNNATIGYPSANVAMAGTYRVLIRDNNSCEIASSPATLTVNSGVNFASHPQNRELCAGEALNLSITTTGAGSATYQWNLNGNAIAGATGTSYSVASSTAAHAGQYTVTLTSTCGTVTSNAATISVNNVSITAQPQNTTVCQGNNAVFTVTASGIQTLGYQWQVNANTGNFVNIPGATSANYTVNNTTLAQNNYSYRVVINDNGKCPQNSAAAVLTVNPSTVITSGPTGNSPVCEGNPINLQVAATGTGTLSYEWFHNGNSIGNNSASYSVSSTVAAAGDYTVQVTGTCGTTAMSAPYNMVVNAAAQNNRNVTGNEACSGSNSSVQVLNSQQGVTYQPFIGGVAAGSTVNGNGSDITLSINSSALSPGNNTVTIRVVGCNTVDLINNATVLVMGPLSSINGNQDVCADAATAMAYNVSPVTGASTYNWTATGGTTITSGNGTTSVIANVASSGSVITVQPATANGLTCGIRTIQVTLQDPYVEGTIQVSEDTICAGNQITFTVVNSNASHTWTASSSAGVTIQNPNANSTTIKFDVSGVYTIIASPQHACATNAQSLQTNVVIIQPPVANAGADMMLDNFQDAVLNGSLSSQGQFYQYQWTATNNSVVSNPKSINPTVTPAELSNTYVLTVSTINNASCSATDAVNVSINIAVKIPNVFSPNGDGIHDEFVIQNIQFFPNSILTIYNQWGETVFKSDKGYPQPWNGKRGGQDAGVSTYYYVLELNENDYKPVSGSVNILK
ncbi:MAG: gliding motility-associated C-terminal domain-containing protein [Cytophagaceae bacterium]